MEAKTSSWWSSATNWTISNGSLDSIIKFESSSNSQSIVDSNRDSPLILNPPTPDSFPCDIKLSFSQKHEIRQVYVRSTARVYELYYAPALETSDEYLSTVQCSTAVREEELIDATNEDDWVEVNFPDSPTLDNRNSSLTTKTCVNTRNIEDFYEATTEITDAEPCMSLTLRFLSIEGEGCVYVDKVYVFTDPIESKDRPGNSAGSSLIAMLVPIMQLSKPITCWSQNKHTSNQTEKQEYFEITEPAKVQIPLPVLNIKRKMDCRAQNNFPCSQLERLMEQLIMKVSIIEDLCLRFEENMLKPINSIEARLQWVEQQLELLSKKSQDSRFPFCTTFSAPFEFSDDENCNGQLSKDTHHPSFTASKSTRDESWNNEPSKYIRSPQVLVDVPFEEKSEGVDKCDQLYEGQCISSSASIICPSAQAKHDLRNKDYEITKETSEQEVKKGDTSIDIPRSSYDSVVDFYSTHEPKFDSSPEHSPKSCVDLSTEAEEIDANASFVQESEDGLLTGSKSGASGVEDGELMITLTKFHRMVVGRL